jgi:hypothetical protein
MLTRQQIFTSAAIKSLKELSQLDDGKTLCHASGAWLAQSGLAAAMDAVSRYQHQQVSRWLFNTYSDVLLRLGYVPGANLRTWAIGLDSVQNLMVTRELIEFNHTLTRLVRLRKDQKL